MCTFDLLVIYYWYHLGLVVYDRYVSLAFISWHQCTRLSISTTHYWYARLIFRLCIIVMHIWSFGCALLICKFGTSVMHYWYVNSIFWLHIIAFSLSTMCHQYAHLAFQLCIVIMNIWPFICLSLICIFGLLVMYYHYENLTLQLCHWYVRSIVRPFDYALSIRTFGLLTMYHWYAYLTFQRIIVFVRVYHFHLFSMCVALVVHQIWWDSIPNISTMMAWHGVDAMNSFVSTWRFSKSWGI